MPNHEKFDGQFTGQHLDTAAKIWHKDAPSDVVKAYASGDTSSAWAAWTAYLAARELSLANAAAEAAGEAALDEHPLRWAWTAAIGATPLVSQWPQWEKCLAGKIDDPQALLEEARRDLARYEAAYEESDDEDAGAMEADGLPIWVDPLEEPALRAMLWANILPHAAEALGETWWEVLDALLSLVDDATALDANRHPLAWQMLGGELGLTLAYLFPELKPCRQLASTARAALTDGIEVLLDGVGQPHARHLALHRPLLACWTRSRLMGLAIPKAAWKKKTQEQYEWTLRAVLRMTRADGTAMLAPPLGLYDAWRPELFQAAIACSSDDDDAKIAAVGLPGTKKARLKKVSPLELPGAGYESEWSETAVLRTNWTRDDSVLPVTYDDGACRCEFAAYQQTYWSGQWDFRVALDGRPLQPVGPWEHACWQSDDDVDYLELSIELEGGVQVQRHLMLAHNEEVVFIADAVLGETTGELQYEGRLPLAPRIREKTVKNTRELVLAGEQQSLRVFPLALPEWTTDESVGEIAVEEGTLVLRQEIEGHSLFAPLLFDFNPKRCRSKRLTWRQLTVAEKLVTMRADQAVGYRLQIEDEQWLFYRSLVEAGNRTVLGHNLVSETLAAVFNEDGSIEKLMETGE